MRISDWSSDVCSSDLLDTHGKRTIVEADRHPRNRNPGHRPGNNRLHPPVIRVHRSAVDGLGPVSVLVERKHLGGRKSVVEGKSGSVRVDLGGRRIMKKNKRLAKSNYIDGINRI